MNKDKECLYKDRATAITSAMKQEIAKRHNAMGGPSGRRGEGKRGEPMKRDSGKGQIPGACDDRLKR